MFTGIVTTTGRIVAVVPEHAPGITRLRIDPQHAADDLAPGGSMAVNGVCLTALTDPELPTGFAADVMGETLERTNIGSLRPGAVVNLERCTQLGERLDGHIVQGHVDATGVVEIIEPQGEWTRIRVSVPDHLAGQIAEKGSITVDGVSLTVTAVNEPRASAWFEVGLIPVTLTTTRLGGLQVGERVNVETDVLAKYVARLLAVGGAR